MELKYMPHLTVISPLALSPLLPFLPSCPSSPRALTSLSHARAMLVHTSILNNILSIPSSLRST